MDIRKMYKIHGLDTVNGLANSANTRKFYETHEEAVAAAKNCCNKKDPPSGIVVFKAVTLVRPVHAPVEVIDVETGETL